MGDKKVRLKFGDQKHIAISRLGETLGGKGKLLDIDETCYSCNTYLEGWECGECGHKAMHNGREDHFIEIDQGLDRAVAVYECPDCEALLCRAYNFARLENMKKDLNKKHEK